MVAYVTYNVVSVIEFLNFDAVSSEQHVLMNRLGIVLEVTILLWLVSAVSNNQQHRSEMDDE
jgi:hypothetical protein